MKACVLNAVNDLRFTEVPMPQIKENEVLLKIRACGICSSDIDRVFKTGTYHFPTIPGHEFAGEIVALGSNVDPALLHKRAAVFPLLPCQKCPSCEIGEYARCEKYNYFGSRCDGGFAEYLAVPVWNLVLAPDKTPFSSAALCEPTAVALHAICAASFHAGDTVAIIGNGTIGLLAAMWATICGAGKVILVGRSEQKVDFAKSLGFSDVISSKTSDVEKEIFEQTAGRGVDCAIELVGSSQAIITALNVVKKGGTVVLTGNPSGDVLLPKATYWKVLRSELNLKGTWNSSYNSAKNDWQVAMNYISNGMLPVEKLITHRFSLENFENAFEAARGKKDVAVKVMFEVG